MGEHPQDYKYCLIYRGLCDLNEVSILGTLESFDPQHNRMIVYSPLNRYEFQKYASEVLQTCIDQIEVHPLFNDR